MRYPVVSGLCLIAKETEQEVTMTLFYYLNINVTKYNVTHKIAFICHLQVVNHGTIAYLQNLANFDKSNF